MPLEVRAYPLENPHHFEYNVLAIQKLKVAMWKFMILAERC